MKKRLFHLPSVNKTFLLYFISYMAVIIVPIAVIGLFSYKLSVRVLEDELSRTTGSSLIQVSTAVRSLTDDVNRLSVILGIDSKLGAYANAPDSAFLLNDIVETIREAASKNTGLQAIRVHFDKNNVTLSSSAPGNSDPARWTGALAVSGQDSLWLPTVRRQNSDGVEDHILTFTRKFPTGYDKTLGAVSLDLYESRISDTLEKMKINSHSTLFVLSPEGTLLSGTDKNLLGKNMVHEGYIRKLLSLGNSGYYIDETGRQPQLICFLRAEPGWVYVSVTPTNYLTDKLSYIGKITLLVCLMMMFLGIIVSYRLSRTMFNPVRSLMDKLRAAHKDMSSGRTDAFSYLSSALDGIVSRNRSLESSFYASQPLFRQRFLNELLGNSCETAADIRSQLDFLALNLTDGPCLVMVVEIDKYQDLLSRSSVKDMSLYKFAMQNVLEELTSAEFPCLSSEIRENQIALLVMLPENDPSSGSNRMTDLAEQAKDTLSELFGFTVTVGIGNAYPELLQAFLSFREASSLLRYKLLLGRNRVIPYREFSSAPEAVLSFSVPQETRLINALKSGNAHSATLCLTEVRDDILQKELAYDTIFRIYNRLLESAINALDQSGLSVQELFGNDFSAFRALAACETLDEIHTWLSGFFERLTECMHTPDKNNRNIQEAIAFIDTHYPEDLSVESIAAQVSLNTTYLCRVFKQSTGRTVLEHLTARRLEEGRRLLCTSALSVNDIARAVGYNNTQSFIRFFKKYEGITPGEYRSSQQNG